MIEHLHDDRYLGPLTGEMQIDLIKKEVVINHIARTTLVRIRPQ